MTYRKCSLHIGMEKTGTTSIQGMMAASRKILAGHGIVYSRAAGRDNHTNLIAYARDDDKTDNQRKRALAQRNVSLEGFRVALENEIAEEAQANSGSWLILSNEHLQSRLTNRREKQRLKNLLAPHCGSIDVYLYLRRQDEVATSLYSTRLRSGSTSEMSEVFPNVSKGIPYFYDYLTICREFADVFGHENLYIRVYDRTQLKNEDACADFRQWIGIPSYIELLVPGRFNESITLEAQYLLSWMNKVNPMFLGVTPNPARADVGARLDRIAPGRGKQPDRVSALHFYDAMRERNRLLFNEFEIEGRGFAEDFESYPEDGEQRVDLERLAKVACLLFRDVAEELAELKQTNEEMKKRLAGAKLS